MKEKEQLIHLEEKDSREIRMIRNISRIKKKTSWILVKNFPIMQEYPKAETLCVRDRSLYKIKYRKFDL